MRITGLSSGMDIDSMVSKLMTAERIPMDRLAQNKQLLSWKEDGYREVNTKLNAFRSFLDQMRFSGSWTQTKVSSSDSSAVSVSATPSASTISHTIEVTNLASSANLAGSNTISQLGLQGSGLAANTVITAGVNDQINVTLNGVTKTIKLAANGAGYSQSGLASELQNELNLSFGGNQILVNLNGGNLNLTPQGNASFLPQLTVGAVSGNNGLTDLGFQGKQSFKLNTDVSLASVAGKFNTPSDSNTLTPEVGLTYGTFSINGVAIAYDGTDTLKTIMNKVNSSAAGVNMSYDSITDKVTITGKTTGSASQIKLEQKNGNGNLLAYMGFQYTKDAVTNDFNFATVSGTDASVNIDGVSSQRSSNTFTIDGVTYTLNGKTASPLTVSVTRDTDAIFNKIKDFVNNYNDLVDMTNSKLNEVKNRDYAPLTDDQKKNMKDADITLWENKAKSGLLQHDDILDKLKTSLRSFATQTVQGITTSYNALYKAGITTMPYDRSQPNNSGKLQIDESKLKAAIADDPDGVISLFANQPGTAAPADQKGIGQALYDTADASIKSLVDRAGRTGGSYNLITNSLGKQVNSIELQLLEMQDKLTKKEDFYYNQFSQMETAIQNGNSQMAWLSSQMG
jgi:flagellar hook-associated protein 2